MVTATAHAIETEFVCIVRPIARAATPDGGPLRYRVSHRAAWWGPAERPKLEQRVTEGTAELSTQNVLVGALAGLGRMRLWDIHSLTAAWAIQTSPTLKIAPIGRCDTSVA